MGTQPRPRAEGPERLQRALARAGLGSRRGVEELIRQGRVRIGQRIASLGDRVDPWVDQVSVDGVPVPVHPELRYFAFNKPSGVTTTLRDPHAARSVAAYLPSGPRVFPVGRLDRDSEGLLLLTNDGDLAFRLQHPRFGIEKEYLVEVAGRLPRAAHRALTTGISLEDGSARALRVGPVLPAADRSAVSMVMGEGRKREIRRMFEELGYPVRRLVRVRVGPVRLGRLGPGRIRTLSTEEIGELYRAAGLARTDVRPEAAGKVGPPKRSSRDSASRSPRAGPDST